jgi:hypothetical protein
VVLCLKGTVEHGRIGQASSPPTASRPIDVTANEGGSVRGVKIKDSMLGDRGIESCMRGAFQGMTLPPSILASRSRHPVSEGQSTPDCDRRRRLDVRRKDEIALCSESLQTES